MVEDAVAGAGQALHGGDDPVARIAAAGRAYRAVGAVSGDRVAEMLAAAELALFVRGVEWLAMGFADIPVAPSVTRYGRLRSVTATGDALVELWDDAVVVRTRSDVYALAGQVPAGHDWMEIRTNDGLVSVDLGTGVPAREVTPRARTVRFADVAFVWAALFAPAALAHDHDPRTRQRLAFEALPVDGGPVVVTGIEQSELLHAYFDGAAAAWITSPQGVHVVADSHVIDPPVPLPPAALELTLVDGGTVTTLTLRP